MADPSLGTATLRTRIDTSGLKAGLTTAGKDVEQFSQTSSARLKAIGSNIAAGVTVASAAITATGAALFRAANQAAAYADEVDKAALRTRFTRETVQELRFVTDQLGGSFGTVETAVVGLTQRLAGAEQGGDRQAAAFERLGVALRGTNGELRSSEELFFDSVNALQGMSNETERAVLAQEVFGRSAAQLGPILAAGAGSVEELRVKARELGLVLDGESVAALVAYKDQLSALQQQFGSASREVALQFLPLLTEGVLPAVERALAVFRAMPEPVQRGAAALTAFGAAGTAAVAALRLLGVSTAALFGPAGLIIAGVAAVATLGLAIAGPGSDSLTKSAERGAKAFNEGNSASLTGALDDVIAKFDGDFKQSLVNARDELAATGRVGVQAAQDIEAAFQAVFLRNSLSRGLLGAFPTAAATGLDLAGNASIFGDRAIPGVGALVNARIAVGDLRGALDLTNDALDTLTSNFLAVDARVLRDFSQFRDDIARAIASVDAAAFVPAPLSTGSGRALGSAGTGAAAARVLADPAAEARAWTGRLLAEVEFGLRDAGSVFDVLNPRLLELRTEAGAALSEFGFSSPQFQDTVAKIAVVSDALKDLGFTVAEDAVSTAAQDAVNRFQQRIEGLAIAGRAAQNDQNADRRTAANAEVARTEAALDTYSSALERLAIAGRDALTRQSEAAAAARAAVDAEKVAASERALIRYGFTLEALAVRGREAALANAELERARVQEQAEIARSGQALEDLFRPGRIISSVQARANIDEAAAVSADEANRALQSFQQRLERLAQAGRAVAVAAPRGNAAGEVFTPPTAPPEIQGFIDAGAKVRLELAKGADLARQGAIETRQQIVTAGIQFAGNLAAAIKSGSPSGIFGAITGGAGSIISILNPLVGTIFGTIAGFIGGFLPGANARQQEAARASGANVRSAPAINLNFTFNQSLALASLTDPASRQALASQATDAFARMEAILTNVVMPRIERLEAAS